MFITPTDSLLSDEVFTSFVSAFSDMTDLQFVWGGRCQHSACRCWEEACIRILVQTPPSAAGPGHALPPAPQSAERWHLHRKHTKEDISLQTAALTALQNIHVGSTSSTWSFKYNHAIRTGKLQTGVLPDCRSSSDSCSSFITSSSSPSEKITSTWWTSRSH